MFVSSKINKSTEKIRSQSTTELEKNDWKVFGQKRTKPILKKSRKRSLIHTKMLIEESKFKTNRELCDLFYDESTKKEEERQSLLHLLCHLLSSVLGCLWLLSHEHSSTCSLLVCLDCLRSNSVLCVVTFLVSWSCTSILIPALREDCCLKTLVKTHWAVGFKSSRASKEQVYPLTVVTSLFAFFMRLCIPCLDWWPCC